MITAADVMTRNVTTVSEEETVEGLIHLLRVSHFTGVPVVDSTGKAVGLISETDILRAVAYSLSPPGSSDEMAIAKKDESRDRGAAARLLKPLRLPGFEQAMQQPETSCVPAMETDAPAEIASRFPATLGKRSAFPTVSTAATTTTNRA